MRKQDYLISLIQSLSTSEKRYFKVFCKEQAGGKKYIDLFNALENSDTYDVKALTKKLDISTATLAHEKEYLQEVLLRSLRLFNENNYTDMKLQAEFMEVSMLLKKGLTAYGISHAKKLYAKAVKFERFTLALNTGRLLSMCHGNLRMFDEMHEYNRLEMELLEALTEYSGMIHLRDRLMEPVLTRKDLSAVADISSNKLFTKKSDLLKSWHAKLCQSEIGIFYYQYIQPDANKALDYALASFGLFQQSPHFKENIPSAYFGLFQKLCVRYYGIGKYKEALRYADMMIEETEKEATNIPAPVLKEHNRSGKGTKMTLLSLLHRFEEAAALAAENYYLKDELNPGESFTFLVDYALALFHTSDYDACHEQLTIIMDKNTSERMDMQLTARLVFIMLQLQLKNYSIVAYQVKSVRAWKKRTNTDLAGAAPLLAWLDKLGKAGLKHTLTETFAAFKEDLQSDELKKLANALALDKWKLAGVK